MQHDRCADRRQGRIGGGNRRRERSGGGDGAGEGTKELSHTKSYSTKSQ